MTWAYKNRGKGCHWVLDLYDRLNLPVLPSVVTALNKTMEEKMRVLDKQQSDACKKKRIQVKVADGRSS